MQKEVAILDARSFYLYLRQIFQIRAPLHSIHTSAMLCHCWKGNIEKLKILEFD